VKLDFDVYIDSKNNDFVLSNVWRVGEYESCDGPYAFDMNGFLDRNGASVLQTL
jgi:hypothetical protein